MKNLLIVATSALCILLTVGVPLPEQDVSLVQIPLEGNKELDILSLPENNQGQLSERNKRTIGVLRQLFPELSKKVEQVIEESVQLVLPIIFRNVGPLLLRGGLGGLSGGGTPANSNDDDFDNDDFDDDDDDDDNDNKVSSNNDGSTSTREGAGGRKVSILLPTFPPDTDDDEDEDENINNTNNTENEDDNKDESNTVQGTVENSSTAKSTDTTQMTSSGNDEVDLVALSERLESFNRVVRNTASQTKDAVAESKSDKGDSNDVIATADSKEDSNTAASDNAESKSPSIDELTLEDEPKEDDRNKRFLSFGFGGSGGGSGGSGNFLFDIIRRTADRAARAAGTIYRVAAGTESFDLDINKQAIRATDDDTDFEHNNNDDNDSTSRKLSAGNDNGLVGGSAGTEQTDERENAPEGEAIVGKSADGYTEGIPGPVTRLFVLANRGLANLIQDLILRIAQTSERVVNFKARLITSLI